MKQHNRKLRVLMPFHEDFLPVYRAIQNASNMLGMHCDRSDDDPRTGNIVERIIHGIYESNLIVADITGSNPNVLFELGVANAFGKTCFMIRQDSDEDRPFDLRAYDITPYKNTLEGLDELKIKITGLLRGASPVSQPVHDAMISITQRTRLTLYLLCGATFGAFFGFFSSCVSVPIGSFARPLVVGKFLGSVTGSGLTGLLYGVLLYGASVLLWNLRESWMKRVASTIAGTIAGCASGIVALAIFVAFLQGSTSHEMAWSVFLSYVMMFSLAGAIYGLCTDNTNRQHSAKKPPFAAHIYKAIVLHLAIMGVFVVLFNLGKEWIVNPLYLSHYLFLDSVGDAARLSIWGISMVSMQWWLKWKVKLYFGE